VAINQSQISGDLKDSNLSIVDKLKPAKTTINSKCDHQQGVALMTSRIQLATEIRAALKDAEPSELEQIMDGLWHKHEAVGVELFRERGGVGPTDA
jgi:hypothetical protein